MGVPGLFAYLRRRYPKICSAPDPPRPDSGPGAAADDTIDPTGLSACDRRHVDNLYIDMWVAARTWGGMRMRRLRPASQGATPAWACASGGAAGRQRGGGQTAVGAL